MNPFIEEQIEILTVDADGNLHSYNDEPAAIYPDGTKYWSKNGWFHRIDGPAAIYPNGTKEWYQNGRRHREDGPAIEYPNGDKFWFINERQLCEREFNNREES